MLLKRFMKNTNITEPINESEDNEEKVEETDTEVKDKTIEDIIAEKDADDTDESLAAAKDESKENKDDDELSQIKSFFVNEK